MRSLSLTVIVVVALASIALTAGSSTVFTLASPSEQPVYGKIAFMRQEGTGWPVTTWDIYLMNADGTSQTELVSNGNNPHFNSDGTKIVFDRKVSGKYDVYIMDSSGTGVKDLTSDLTQDSTQPKFSWDGTKIVFTVAAGTGDHDIYTMNVDGSSKTPVITGSSTNDEWPSFSPDGQSIVFKRFNGDPSNMKSWICTYKISDGTPTEITDGNYLDEMPYYSPDGVYVIFKRGTTNPQIYRIRLSDGTIVNLTNNSVTNDAPTYSYEGDKIAWFSASYGPTTAEIWIMNSDGTGKTQLTNNNVADWNPTFSPASPPKVTMSVSYSVVGGGSPKAPVFNYLVGGAQKSLTLSKVGNAVSVDAGSSWSVTPNPLGGSSSTQRWDSNQPLTGTASSTTLVFTFYRQTLQRLYYSVSGGGSGYSPPTLQANQFGSPVPVTLTTTATKYWFDYGSAWTVGPNPLVGSTPTERSFSTQTITGTISSGSTRAFKFQHQYYLTMQVSPAGAGSVSPGSGWHNPGQIVTISATANTGHTFQSWTGTGTGSYTGTSSRHTITMNSPITETANFS